MKYASSPAWTLLGKSKSTKQTIIPAPNAYSPDKHFQHKTPAWKIGSSQRTDFKLAQKTQPGPGAYNPQTKQHINSIPIYHYDKSKKLSHQILPGPGHYNVKFDKLKKSYNAYYMGSKLNKYDNDKIPGPGAYNPKHYSYSRTYGKIGHQKRISTQKSQNPGPGTYQLSKPLNSARNTLFPKQKRMKDIDLNNQLGPGQYNFNTYYLKQSLGSGRTIGSRHQINFKDHTPGPGAYQPTYADKPKNPIITISPKTNINKNGKDSPGPGAYDSSTFLNHSGGYYTIGKQAKNNHIDKSNSPGPGAYNYSINLKKSSPSYSLGRQLKKINNQKIPGPNQYNPKLQLTKFRPQSTKIGNTTRNFYKAQKLPGPGYYNINNSNDGPKWPFSKQIRDKNLKNNQPGPGAYQIISTIANVPNYILPKSYSSNYLSK